LSAATELQLLEGMQRLRHTVLVLAAATTTLCLSPSANACSNSKRCLVAMVESAPRVAALTSALPPAPEPALSDAGDAHPAAVDLGKAARHLASNYVRARAIPVASEREIRDADARRNKVETPWIWRQLKTYAYSQFPRHRTRRFEAVWAPVIVRGPSDTIPGVGLKGLFW
jgi:hypothetical protein